MHAFVILCTFACLLFAAFRLFRDRGAEEPHAPKGTVNPWLLFLVSAATLYVELVMIRWVGTEVRIFAFVQNIVLITCFLGFGVGCFTSDRPGSLMPSLYTLTLLAIIVSMPFIQWQDALLHLSNVLTLSSDAALWGYAGIPFPIPPYILAVIAIALVAAMLWLIAAAMIPLGRWVGYCFDNSKNVINAYTVNLAGSLAGTWLLLLLSVMSLPPSAWLGLCFALVLLATPRSGPNWAKGALLLVPFAVMVQGGLKTEAIWSPYQKLAVEKKNDAPEYMVTVNNVGYMTMASTQKDFLRKNPEIAKAYRDSVYDSPFRFVPRGAKVLIVGAGAGNDASAALRNGASQVDAVEIDPVIHRIGKKLHPDKPYDSKKVNVIINDARNFFRRSKEKYDAVIFGLLDSHTEVSGYTNMRVDNYVYTKESFQQARALLKPDGVMIVKFEVREPWTWIGRRFYATLTEVFGKEPVTYHIAGKGNMWSGTVFLSSDGKSLEKKTRNPAIKKYLAGHKPQFDLQAQGAPRAATDDWPYPYNFTNNIPQTYLTVAIILIALAWFMVRKVIVLTEKQTWTMFMLGAGFMLMETQMISRLTLYFGTTWIVNSIAISTILAVLVLANLYVLWRKKIDSPAYPAILVAALALNFFYPWEQLPYEPWIVGLMLAGAYAVAVFMAGILFVSTFARAERKSAALGANVMGAVVGGLSQNLSFIFGLKALLPLAALCYAGYFIAARRAG